MAIVQTATTEQTAPSRRSMSITKLFGSSSQGPSSKEREGIPSIRKDSIGGEPAKGRRKSSIPSLLLRKGSTFSVSSRSKQQQFDEPVSTLESGKTVGALFLDLPAELKTLIISCLDFQDILVLRRTAPAFKILVDLSELEIAMYHIQHKLDSHTLALFPPPESPYLNLEYLSQVNHRLIYSTKLSTSIADYTRDELYRRTNTKLRRGWALEHARLQKKMIPPILTLFKFFEVFQQALIDFYVTGQGIMENQLVDPNRCELDVLNNEFTGSQILEAYKMYQLLNQALDRYWRPPSYATGVERLVRGWTTDPPTPLAYSVLLMIGGIREVAETWNSHKSYAGRRKYLDSTTDRLSLGVVRQSVNSIGVLQSRFQMPMKPLSRDVAGALLPYLPLVDTLWGQAAESALLGKKTVEHMDEVDNYTVWIESLIRGDEDDGVTIEKGEEDDDDEGRLTEEEDSENDPLASSTTNES